MTPKTAAELLTSHFLEAGNFISAGRSQGSHAISASALAKADFDENGFA